ncbi:AAA family ATPase [Kutzneria buriramensis]|uniref:Putative kinase n=1 Tax=Kutzneria buriramensis TaxID=1045776 RepID=A0A3E0GYQ3_9PSEU|nr:AAA family ATPase [Kutzneria buriramensis]REH31172.1 putative kinase [Kutzneria buriramensis]
MTTAPGVDGTVVPLPNPCLIVIMGLSGSGKSTFAEEHFAPIEILSSDRTRAVVSNNAADQDSTSAAFNLLYATLWYRMANHVTTVFDATNLEAAHRERLLNMARRHAVPAIAVVLDVPVKRCLQRIARRRRTVPTDRILAQADLWPEAMRQIGDEDFAALHVFTEDQIPNVVFRQDLPPADDHGRWVHVTQVAPGPGAVFRFPVDEVRRRPDFFDHVHHGEMAEVHAAAERAFTLGNAHPDDLIEPYSSQARQHIAAGNTSMSVGARLKIEFPGESPVYLRCEDTGWTITDAVGTGPAWSDNGHDVQREIDDQDPDWRDEEDTVERRRRLAIIHGAVPEMVPRLLGLTSSRRSTR